VRAPCRGQAGFAKLLREERIRPRKNPVEGLPANTSTRRFRRYLFAALPLWEKSF